MFVSRAKYEHAQALTRIANAALEEAGRMLAREQTRYDALLDKYHALRLAGASIPEPAAVVQPVPKRENDRVTEVIADISESNAKLRTRLHAFVRKQRAEGVDDDAIIQELFNWKEDDGGVPE